jgi:hypothetical protein
MPPHPQPQDRRTQFVGARGRRRHLLPELPLGDPHYGDDLLDHHLNKHSSTIACTTCHAPVYAKCKPTKTFWDWSKAGDKTRKPEKDKYGMKDYNWKKGEFVWKESAKPVYRWYGGFTKRVLLGDRLDLTQPEFNITEPVGSINDPNSKIAPFKIMAGVQAVDAEYKHLLVPHPSRATRKTKPPTGNTATGKSPSPTG